MTNGPKRIGTPVPNGAPDGAPVIPPPPWRASRPATRRSPAGALDRATIVAAALDVIDRDGVDALSLRRLAATLGVAPMAAYWHVRDKAELLDLVGEHVLAGIVLPAPEGDWRDRMRAIQRAMLSGALAHPNAAELTLGRARYSPAGIGLFERLLEVLLDAGLPPDAAFDAYQSLYLFLIGFLRTVTRSPAFVRAQVDGVAYLRSLDPAAVPAVAAVAPIIGGRSPAEQFELGLDVVIAGIEARLLPR